MNLCVIIGMHAAVQFDDEAAGSAEKVHDIGSDYLLSAELEALKLLTAQGLPKDNFRAGHPTAEASSLRQG